MAAALVNGCDSVTLAGDRGDARPLAPACSADSDCASGYCDLGLCVTPQGVYGQPCIVPPRGLDGLRDGKLTMCGAYVCSRGRCRSCVSDDQCQEEYGAPLCVAREDRPGKRCGA